MIVPQGGTRLEPGDRLLVLVDRQSATEVRDLLGADLTAPEGTE